MTLAPIAGMVGGAMAAIKNRPGLAALATGAGFLPILAEEAGASFRGMRALRESGKFSEEELRKARNTLYKAFGTYLSTVAGITGSIAGLGARSRVGRILGEAAPALGSLGALGLAAAAAASIEGSPKLTKEDAEKIRAGMGVKAKIYPSSAKEEGGRWKELGAFYMPPTKNKIVQMLAERGVGKHVPSQKDMKKMFEEGGVVVHPTVVK